MLFIYFSLSIVCFVKSQQALIEPYPIPWFNIQGFKFDFSTLTLPSKIVANLAACQAICQYGPGCDWYAFNSLTKQCDIKYYDLIKGITMSLKVNPSLASNFHGSIFTTSTLIKPFLVTTVAAGAACNTACVQSTKCHYALMDVNKYPSTDSTNPVICSLYGFVPDPNVILGFRSSEVPLNYNPSKLGRFDLNGNTGIVSIAATLMPNGKLLFGSRPEYQRGGPNLDNMLRPAVQFGEIAAIFDPVTGTHVPSPIDDNLFCHGAVLLENGKVFQAGGDDRSDIYRNPSASIGLKSGLNEMRTYDYVTDKWSVIGSMVKGRWYPTVLRVTSGKVFIFGGFSVSLVGVPVPDLEIYTPGVASNVLVSSPLLKSTMNTGYVKAHVIPGIIFIDYYLHYKMKFIYCIFII